jgi:hypothetical protein
MALLSTEEWIAWAIQRRTLMQSNFSKEQPVQDESDGLLFFHTHSVWEAVAKLEKFYECTIYGVLELQEVEENIQYYGADEQKFSKKQLLEAISYAYDKVENSYEYEIYMETIVDYLQENYGQE